MQQQKDEGEISIYDANVVRRVGAFVIDFVLFGIFILLILLLLSAMDLVSPSYAFRIFRFRTGIYEGLDYFNSVQDIIIHIGTSVFFLGYFTILESKYLGGQTIGKKLLKIWVVDDEGNKPTLWKSFLRNSTKYILRIPLIGIPFGVLEILLLFNYSSRTGDMIADTSVTSGVNKADFTKISKEEKYTYE